MVQAARLLPKSPDFPLGVSLSVSGLVGMVHQLSPSLTMVPEVSSNHTVKAGESPVGISLFQNLESWAYHLRAEEILRTGLQLQFLGQISR